MYCVKWRTRQQRQTVYRKSYGAARLIGPVCAGEEYSTINTFHTSLAAQQPETQHTRDEGKGPRTSLRVLGFRGKYRLTLKYDKAGAVYFLGKSLMALYSIFSWFSLFSDELVIKKKSTFLSSESNKPQASTSSDANNHRFNEVQAWYNVSHVWQQPQQAHAWDVNGKKMVRNGKAIRVSAGPWKSI